MCASDRTPTRESVEVILDPKSAAEVGVRAHGTCQGREHARYSFGNSTRGQTRSVLRSRLSEELETSLLFLDFRYQTNRVEWQRETECSFTETPMVIECCDDIRNSTRLVLSSIPPRAGKRVQYIDILSTRSS
jgi:hypothetical protein